MRKIFPALIIFVITISSVHSQVFDPVSWSFSSKYLKNNTYELRFVSKIEAGWHMYGLNIPEGGPIATSFHYDTLDGMKFKSPVEPVNSPDIKYDAIFEMDVELHDGEAVFIQTIQIPKGINEITGYVEYMACDDSKCLPPKDTEFRIKLNAQTKEIIREGKVKSHEVKTEKEIVKEEIIETDTASKEEIKINPEENQPDSEADTLAEDSPSEEGSLTGLFLIAFLAGLGALLTPCVFPIIPLTVSFFMRDTKRIKSVFNGVMFGISIVFIYTLVGFLAGLFRIDLVRLVSSHWLPNIIFFLIFIALAFSFFGMFEITLPSSLSTKIDKRADKGGILGPFFIALATVVISFSCTGPIVGVVLGSALQGDIIKPVIGMFGFSTAFALPFTLLAIFPGMMKKLPKSGGWLNSVKVFFAFILLAFSLIFITNLRIDFITRDVILAIAIVIFFLLGVYLLGKIKFSHDSDLPNISVPRLLLAVAAFSIAVYMIPGLFGAPLNAIAPFLPPKEEMKFDLTKSHTYSESIILNDTIPNTNTCNETPKYSDFLHMPLGLKGYFDYDEALACAKELNKPVLLDFAGHSCKNCKKMYAEVWSDERVLNILRNEFVIAVLYTDDRTKLPETDWVTSELDGKVKNIIGKKFNDLQIRLLGSNALPLYTIVNANGEILTSQKYVAYSPDIQKFIDFLKDGLSNFKEEN
ncbi:MAG: thioredoxin family protein [Bacteroidales bacterium]|nr:thioredoxin family protein [Bacteroidales bacterium]